MASFEVYEVIVGEDNLICNTHIKHVEYLMSYIKEEDRDDVITEEEFHNIIDILIDRGTNFKEKSTVLIPFKLNDWEFIGYAFIVNKHKNDEGEDTIVDICMIMPSDIGINKEDVEHALSVLYPSLHNNSNITFTIK